MQTRFVGTITNKIDDKGRVSVPSAFRKVLSEGDVDRDAGKPASFYMIVVRKEGLIECVSAAQHERIAQKIDELEDPFVQDALAKRYFNLAHTVTLDANGRIQVGPLLREIVGDAEALAFVGENHRFRIVASEAGARPEEDAYEAAKALLPEGTDLDRYARLVLR